MNAAVYRIRGAEPEAGPRVGSFRIVRDALRRRFELQELREIPSRAWPWFWRIRVHVKWIRIDYEDWDIQGERLAEDGIMRLKDVAVRRRDDAKTGRTIHWSEP